MNNKDIDNLLKLRNTGKLSKDDYPIYNYKSIIKNI